MGLANAAILARQNHVTAVDIVAERVDTVNRRESPFADAELSQFLATQDLDLRATLDAEETYAAADYVVIATPTDYDPQTLAFDTASVESVIRTVVKVAPHAVPVVKSTVPVGFCERMTAEHGRQVVFSPEFLREGHALHDNLHPSRIIVGDATPEAKTFADLLVAGSDRPATPVLMVRSTEAEAIKLFSNTYLAMRVAFFNELDTFAVQHDLNSRAIIDGVSMEPRIGHGYNNPSFGYGGYCLPEGHAAAAGQLRGRPAAADRGDRRLQRHPQGLHRGAGDRPRPEARRHLPARHEGRLRQLPGLEHPRDHQPPA